MHRILFLSWDFVSDYSDHYSLCFGRLLDAVVMHLRPAGRLGI